jgi:hypothetical protein
MNPHNTHPGTATPRFPPDGDILLTFDERLPLRYTITQVPDGPRMSWPSREAAELAVRHFAKRQAVDAWAWERGALVRLAAHRPSPQIPAGFATARDPRGRKPTTRQVTLFPSTPEPADRPGWVRRSSRGRS